MPHFIMNIVHKNKAQTEVKAFLRNLDFSEQIGVSQ